MANGLAQKAFENGFVQNPFFFAGFSPESPNILSPGRFVKRSIFIRVIGYAYIFVKSVR